MPVTVKVVTCSSVNQRFHKPSSSLSNLLEQLTELKTVYLLVILKTASQMVLVLKNSPANAINVRDESSIPGLERSPGGGNGNILQYSCLGNPRDRGAW